MMGVCRGKQLIAQPKFPPARLWCEGQRREFRLQRFWLKNIRIANPAGG